MSPQVGSESARPAADATHGLVPTGPSKSGDWPVGMLAMTVGGFVVRTKTTTLLLALPTNMVLPSAVTTIPHGQDKGFTPLPRDAQHWAPVKPPKRPLGPNPGIWKGAFLQPNRVKFPRTETVGGMVPTQPLATSPPCATPFAPVMTFTATLLIVSKTATSRPMRSATKSLWVPGSIQLMSKELNGPP